MGEVAAARIRAIALPVLRSADGMQRMQPNPVDPIPFHVVLQQLRDERDMNLEDVGFGVRRRAKELGLAEKRLGISYSSLQKHAAGAAKGPPSRHLMELVAEVLGVEPFVFAEYWLARARALLDEREVGLEEALKNFTRLELALQEQAQRGLEAAPRGDERAAPKRPRRPQ